MAHPAPHDRFPGVIRTGILLLLAASPALAGNPRLDFAYGVLATERGNREEAQRLFEQARKEDPTASPLVKRAITARLDAGDRSGAITLYRDLAAARQDNLGIQLGYADFLTQQGRGDSLATKLAEETLTNALKKNPGDPELIRRLFQQASAALDKPRQEELLEMLPEGDPAATILYASLARGLMDSEDEAARGKIDRRFLQAMEAHPYFVSLARAASDHFNNTGRTDEAISILKKHAEAEPSSLDLRTRLGVLCFSAKRNEEGEAVLKEVLVIHPRQALAHQSLAKFYRLNNRPELARVHAGELLKIRGGSPSEFITLADEWLDAGESREARLLLENAVFAHPGDFELASRLAIATCRDPETSARASRLFREAEAAQPADGKLTPDFLLESAEVMIGEGQGKAAEERLRNAIRAYPPGAKKETAAALRRLAGLWESENRNLDAAKSLRQRADSLDH